MLSFNSFTILWLCLGILLIPVLLRISAPYGRYIKSTWGPLINNRAGWIIMELPALAVFTCYFLFGCSTKSYFAWFAFSLWILHYTHRVFIFPLNIKTQGKKMPLIIVAMAVFFNYINGFINGYYLGNLAPITWDQLLIFRIILGTFIFFSGLIINIYSDYSLLKLRGEGETKYKIPYNFLFRYISCPNYFGEIIEWLGFTIICWSLPALAFWVWTIANLLPRAISHHKWYKHQFQEYPEDRKALIPFVL
jgi:3-oxo-5-alpha-steroid 4-dehydrogenase 1